MKAYLGQFKQRLFFDICFCIAVFVILMFSFASPAFAGPGVPKILNHQGRLLNASGALLGGSGTNFCFRFSIYDNSTVGSGSRLWPASAPSTMTVTVANGVYNVGIGDTASGGDELTYNFQDNEAIYLNVEVASQVSGSCTGVSFETVSPRQRIVSSGYAINAGTVMGLGQSAIGTTTPISSAMLSVVASSSNAIPLVIRATTSQTVDLFRIQNVSGSGLVFVNSSGGFYASSTFQVTNSTTLYGAFLQNGFTDDCSDESRTVLYNAATGRFSCGIDSSGAGLTSAGGWTTNNTGLVIFSTSTDQVVIGSGSAIHSAVLSIVATTSASHPLVIRAASSQSADLLVIQDSSSNNLFLVNSDGGFLTIASSSVGNDLTVSGDLLVSSTLQASGLSIHYTGLLSLASSTFRDRLTVSGPFVASSTVTSSFANGMNIINGCFAVRGRCLSTPERAPGLASIQVFTASGTWSRPIGVSRVRVQLVGGGGGGAGGTVSSDSGGGGGAGGYSEEFIDVTATSSVGVRIGDGGGRGGVGTNGNDGATTTFGGASVDSSVFLEGGGGWGGSNDGNNAPINGSGSGKGNCALGGDINICGGDGGSPDLSGRFRSFGGSSYFGGGGTGQWQTSQNGDGGPGKAYGSGGGAGIGNGVGGAGANGVVIAWEYATSAVSGADLAEWYGMNEETEAGDIVGISQEMDSYESALGAQKIAILQKANAQNSIVGIVSTLPYTIIGEDIVPWMKQARPVALSGRVQVKVSDENGSIRPGDRIALSSIPGVGAKAVRSGMTVGIALEAFTPGDNTQITTTLSGKEVRIGKVLVFTNMTYAKFGLEPNLASLLGAMDGETNAPSIDIRRMLLPRLLERRETLNVSSTVSEFFTDRLGVGLELVAPKIATKELFVDHIASASDGDISLSLTPNSSFFIFSTGTAASTTVSASSSPVVSIDAFGNAVFAGAVTADAIHARQITGLEFVAETLTMVSGTLRILSSTTEELAEQMFAGLTRIIFSVDAVSSTLFSLQNELASTTASIEALTSTTEDMLRRLMALESPTVDTSTPQLTLADLLDSAGDSLTINQSAFFGGGIITNSLRASGDAVSFMSDIDFIGRPYMNADSGGFVRMASGTRYAEVVFEREYLATPVVNATVSFEITSSTENATTTWTEEERVFAGDIRYVVTKKSSKGFAILLNKPAPGDIRFSWTALAVKDARLVESLPLEHDPVIDTPPPPPPPDLPAEEAGPETPSTTEDITPLPPPEEVPAPEEVPSPELEPPPPEAGPPLAEDDGALVISE